MANTNKPQRFDKGIVIDPLCQAPNACCSNPTCNTEGMLWVLCCTLRAYLGAGVRTVVTTDQTQTVSGKTFTSPVLNGCLSGTAFLDEDGFCSNSATKVASQQSIKAYVDSQLTAQDLDFTDDCCTACLSIDLDSETLKIAGGNGIATSGAANTLTITTVCSEIVHDCTSGFVANEHINHACITLTAGCGLTGGGNLTASRTFNVGAGCCICVSGCAVSVSATLCSKTLVSSVVNTSLLMDVTCVACTKVAAELRFEERTGLCSNYVGFKAPDSIAANLIWVLPNADGICGQVITTDGCGNLSWGNGGGILNGCNPTLIFRDADGCDNDNNATISVNLTCVVTCTEDADITISQQICGTLTAAAVFDADGNIEFKRNVSLTESGTRFFAPQNLTGTNPQYSFSHSTDSGLYATGSQLRLRWSGSDKINIASGNVVIANPLNFDAGSAGVPGLSIDGDTDTGIFKATCNSLGISAGGTERLRIDATDMSMNVPVHLKNYTTCCLPACVGTGSVTYDSTAGKVVYNDGCNWLQIGSGGGNKLILFDDFEADLCSNVAAYDDVCAATDLTGGCANVTVALETTNPLGISASSYKLSKDAFDRIHQGWAITTDNVPRIASVGGKTVNVSFVYETSACYTSGDIQMFAYRVGSNTLESLNMIQGSTVSNDLPAAPCGGEFTAPITLSACDTSVRIGWHIATANASAYDVIVDAIDISVASKINAPIVSNWESFTPTGSWTCNTTYTGQKRRVGDSLQVQVCVALSGAPNATALTINIPCCLSIDCSKRAGSASNFGTFDAVDSGTCTNRTIGTVLASAVCSVRLFAGSDCAGAEVSNTSPFTFASGDSIRINFSVPICGWNSGNILSTNEIDVSVPKVIARRSACTQTINTGVTTTVIFDTESEDSHSAYDNTTGIFTAPHTGFYLVSAFVKLSDTTTWNETELIQVVATVNGTCFDCNGKMLGEHYGMTSACASQKFSTGGTGLVSLNKGDTLRIGVFQNSGTNLTTHTFNNTTWLTIVGFPDFSVIGVNGTYEVVSATSSTKTPGASGDYHLLTGNSLTLGPGTWRLAPSKAGFSSSCSPTYSSVLVGWYGANGADTSSTPAAISSLTGVTVVGGFGNERTFLSPLPASTDTVEIHSGELIIKTTQETTVYLVTFATMSTAANSRITVYPKAQRLQ